MRKKAFIAKVLTAGIVLNSLSVLVYANTEIPNRYQTLEGEYITIDDSTEDNLEEIEIFGNTVQDPNNLEDIQSVGDLYADENGNPILDSQGREQYEISIFSTGKNLYNEDTIYKYSNHYIESNDWLIPYNDEVNYFLSSNAFSADGRFIYLRYYNKDKKVLFTDYNYQYSNNVVPKSRIPENTAYISLLFRDVYNRNPSLNDFLPVQLEIGSKKTEYKPYRANRETILLPTQLQKVGYISDRLYWDTSKGRYIIEKNIGKTTINNLQMMLVGVPSSTHERIFFKNPDNYALLGKKGHSQRKGYVKGLTTDASSNNSENPHQFVIFHEDEFKWYFPKSELPLDYRDNDIKQYATNLMSRYNYEMYYLYETPILIKTNITSKLKIPTYDEKTHIYADSENGISPTLKVTVDRLPQIAKEAVAQAESDNTNHNIALARMYINMLPESSYKDQLQEQLSDIFSSDMVLDMKTATSNLDIYIKCENILQMSLDTNQISFDDFSGIEDVVKENAVNVTINSSLPYQLNIYLPTEIQNTDKTKTLDKSILNIKESSESNYQTFSNTTDKIVLKDNCSAGNQLVHGVDLKLAGGIAHEKDVYKAIIKLEVEQK